VLSVTADMMLGTPDSTCERDRDRTPYHQDVLMKHLILISITLCACTVSAPPVAPRSATPAPAAKVDPAPCTAVADHVATLFPHDSGFDAAKFAGTCTDEHWTADARMCFLSVPNLNAFFGDCTSKLTDEQRVGWAKAVIPRDLPIEPENAATR
jgi:hypothetical protein